MTTPVPPAGPQSSGGPADVDPWAPPSHGGAREEAQGPGTPPTPVAPYWPPYPVPAPQPRNGTGVAAMVLGIVGAVLGLAVVLFWLSWLPALLAVIFGAIGLGQVRKGLATNRATALAGVVLGVVGLLFSVGAGAFVAVRVHSVDEARRAQEDASRARVEAAIRAARERAAEEERRVEDEQRKRAADEKARRLSFGQSYTYEDGLKVTTAAPEPYVPSETVFEAPRNAKIIQLRITVVNTGSKELSLRGSGSPFVRDSGGNLVFTLIDGSGRSKILDGTLAPGREATGLSAYALPNGTADPFTVEFDYGSGLQRKDVVWSGSPG